MSEPRIIAPPKRLMLVVTTPGAAAPQELLPCPPEWDVKQATDFLDTVLKEGKLIWSVDEHTVLVMPVGPGVKFLVIDESRLRQAQMQQLVQQTQLPRSPGH